MPASTRTPFDTNHHAHKKPLYPRGPPDAAHSGLRDGIGTNGRRSRQLAHRHTDGRSGRVPALPYPPSVRLYATTKVAATASFSPQSRRAPGFRREPDCRGNGCSSERRGCARSGRPSPAGTVLGRVTPLRCQSDGRWKQPFPRLGGRGNTMRKRTYNRNNLSLIEHVYFVRRFGPSCAIQPLISLRSQPPFSWERPDVDAAPETPAPRGEAQAVARPQIPAAATPAR